MGWLLRLYVNALFNGNPFVVGVTLIVALAVSIGPFEEGISKGDPAAIGLMGLVLVGILVLLTVAIIDRRNNPPRGKRPGPSRAGRV